MRRLASITLAATVALVAEPVLARKERVPIEGRGHVLIVQASINQRISGRFLLDTGATYCVLTKAGAADANIAGRKDGRRVVIQTANGVVEATIGEARRIDVGDAVARDVEVAVVDGNPFPGLQGLIGLSFLKSFKYSVDSAAGVLQLEN